MYGTNAIVAASSPIIALLLLSLLPRLFPKLFLFFLYTDKWAVLFLSLHKNSRRLQVRSWSQCVETTEFQTHGYWKRDHLIFSSRSNYSVLDFVHLNEKQQQDAIQQQ
ncbi:hypothetical protein F4859DRAFT_481955 [Xylaria cf. heliscus]|nr:hypothetical protein F4859DRAFT_481955 [Xylaria cf. heliscus]